VWTLDQAITYIQAGTWPTQPVYFIGELYGTVPNNADGYAIASDGAGNLYFSGDTNTSGNTDIQIAKYNYSGNIQWQKSLGDTGYDYGFSIAVDSSGNVYTSSLLGTSAGTSTQFLIAKYNSSGVIQWQRTLGGSLEFSRGNGIAVDSSANVYVVGRSDVAAGGVAYIELAKYNTSGTIQWQRKLSGSYAGSGNGIALDSSGNVYITGGANTAIGGRYFITAKYNTSGTLQWQRQIGDGSFSYDGKGIAVDSSSNVYVCSTSDPAGTGSFIVIAKYDTSGAIQWQRSLRPSGGALANSQGISVDASGNVYVIGFDNTSGSYFYQITKYNTSGTIQWQRKLGNSVSTSYGYGVKIDSSGSVCVIGTSNVANGTYKFLFAKLPSDGSLTGTYVVAGQNILYAASSLTDAATSYNENAAGLTSSTSSLTDAASSLTDVTTSLTSSVTSIP
jgi:hypothetical protein